jgi:hypothetical protein
MRGRPLSLALALAFVLLAAGCTDKLSLNHATLESPSFSLTPQEGDATTTFHVDAGSLSKYNVSWDFGDGTRAYGGSADHKYGFTNGKMTVTLTVTDAAGKQGFATQVVTLGDGVNRPPTARLSAARTWVKVGEPAPFSAYGYDGDGDPLSYQWSVAKPGGAESPAGASSDIRATFDAVGAYTLKLVVRDPKGGSATDSQIVWATKEIPATSYDALYFGNLTVGNGDAGANEKLEHNLGGTAPNQTVDSAVYPFTLSYPGFALVFLTWNDTSGAGAVDLDLELRYAGNGTTIWSSAHHTVNAPDPSHPPPVPSGPPPLPPNLPIPAGPYEYNASYLQPGAYEAVVRGYSGANVAYETLIHASLQVKPEDVAKGEGAP